MIEEHFKHEPVLLDACITGLNIDPSGTYVDCTAGGAGHSQAILARLGSSGRLYAFDKDPVAQETAEKRLQAVESAGYFKIMPYDFSQINQRLREEKVYKINGLLADLGVSSYQLDVASRGFAYMQDGPLDMRMNPLAGQSAAEFLAEVSEQELEKILRLYGEEHYARNIARAIVGSPVPINTTQELVEVIKKALPAKALREKQHPAKRTFQAIRIAVNKELDALEELLESIPTFMDAGGRVAIISFHSLEDRLIKHAYQKWENPCTCPTSFPVCICNKQAHGRRIQNKGILASPEEISQNPRSRSARVRIFEFRSDYDAGINAD